MRKNRSLEYLLNNYVIYQFVNNFSSLLLLCKINAPGIFNMDVFFKFLLYR